MNKQQTKYLVLLFIVFVMKQNLFSQYNESTIDKTSVLKTLTVSGYYRFLGCYTSMNYQYPEMGEVKNKLFLGDDSNIPQLLMNIGGMAGKNTSFSTDLYLWTPLSGSTTDYAKGLNLGVNLTGSHATDFGLFSVKTGGIHWHALSPLTFAANTGYNRYSLFERNPWDPNTKNIVDRYDSYFQNGAMNQDVRWGQQAFQGFIFDGNKLPGDFSFSLMYGKSQFNGGALPMPNLMNAGRVKKDFNTGFLSVNAISSKTFTDSLTKFSVGYNLFTTEFKLEIPQMVIKGEIGAGNYYSPALSGKYGEAIDVRIQLKKERLKVPFELRFIQISPDVINNNGVFWNSSIQEYNANFSANTAQGSQATLIPFASSVVNIGQLTNNRKGVIFNTDLLSNRHKLTIGYSIMQEIKALSEVITYAHNSNNLALSRFWRWNFPSSVGPYGNLNKIYRGVYETLHTADGPTKKTFNSIELNYKLNSKLGKHTFYLFYLGGLYTCKNDFGFIEWNTKSNYLTSFTNQIESYLQLNAITLFSAYLGYDRIYAGKNTQLDTQTLNPKNQTGLSYAVGIDIQLAKQTGLYIRQRWFEYEDKNFHLDKYKGSETTVEIKIFF
jgi:hypothetical protein